MAPSRSSQMRASPPAAGDGAARLEPAPVLTQLAVDDSRWFEFVSSFPRARPFHHPAWTKLLIDAYGFRSLVLALTEASGRVRAGMPIMQVGVPGLRRWVSLPFTDHCPPLSTDRDEPALMAALAAAAHSQRIRRVEVHGAVHAPAANSGTVAVTHVLELQPDPEAVRKTFSRSQVQRNIARGEREDATVRRATSATDLTEVYYGLHVRTRRRQGVPVQPRRFFELLWERMIEPGLGFVLLAYAGTTPIAGAVFLAWNGTVTYKYGASNPDFLKLRPNHLIFWDAIRWSCENEFHTFDFGRSDLWNRGLREFKNGWGTREEPLAYSVVGGVPRNRPSERVQKLMAAVIRRSPLWFCRGLGRALYRFAA
jgi:CelD/BcsL family acetyltransferase involved in cellulose biosynthesis